MAEAALRHEADIDIYHSRDPRNRGVYGGGKFTHTQHGVEVATVTHRGGPRPTWFGSLTWPWGRGSSPESGHFNTRGQLAYYYLTGDRTVLESALEQTALVLYKVTEDKFAQIEVLDRCAGNNLQILTDAWLLTWDDQYRRAAEKILLVTHPDSQWYTSEEGRAANPEKEVGGYWTASICIDAAARFTTVMEEKTGAPYALGRRYVTRYADWASRCLAGGPEAGFFSSWSQQRGGRGSEGPWTWRHTDLVMYGHKFSDDPAVRARCLKAAEGGFEYMRRAAAEGRPVYRTGKDCTMTIGGGHELVSFKRYGGWEPRGPWKGSPVVGAGRSPL